MNTSGWLQLAFFSIVLLALTKPMGLYLVRVLDAEGRTFLDPVLKPVERLIYRLAGIDPAKEQDWKGYVVSVLIFSVVGMLLTYLILRLQYFLPLNPQGFSGVAGDLAFNTAASFTTNTNWQNYGGESTLSYLSQMVGLTFHNFVSAAAGIAIAAALVRGIARDKAATLGNFWTDLTRSCLYLLLPICLVFAVFLVSQGMIQNFSGYQTAKVLDPYTTQVAKKDAGGQEIKDAQGNTVMEDVKVETQTIPQGPVASQVAIKMLGTNGGGFFNANAAHPFEKPDAAVELPPDAVHLPDSRRPDLLPGTDGKEPETRLVGVGRHVSAVLHRGDDLLGGGDPMATRVWPPWGLINPLAIWKARKSGSASLIPPYLPR